MTEYERLDRLRRRYNLRHSDMPWLLRDENNEPLSANIMGTWSSRGTFSRSLPLISNTFYWSADHLMGMSEIVWRADALKAQQDIRIWARQQDMSRMTIAERFTAVWEQWQTLISMREEIWAVLTYMAEFPTLKQDAVTPVRTDTWHNCKANDYQPGRVQIEGAVELTGLPLRWWYTGNAVLLRTFTEDEIRQLQATILDRGLDTYDTEAAVTAFIKATV